MAKTNSTQHGPRFIDLTGTTFGDWYVMKYHSTAKTGHICWLCRCKCGREKPVKGGDLRNGHSHSCHRCKNRTHGMKGTPEHRVWVQMRQRCGNHNHPHYHRYGGRGINVCERWADFENFLADMGHRPSSKHTLERVDNNGNYEPKNCKWATRKEQARNRGTNHLLTHDGRTMSLIEWAETTGISVHTLRYRIYRGWSDEQVLVTPVRGR